MEDAALNVSPGGHSFHAPFKGSSSFDKFAFSPVALECSTSDAHASNLSIVFNNAVYDGNSVDFELACRDNGSEVCWDEQMLPDDKDIVQLGWNTPNFTVKRCSSPLLPSRNVVVLFQHALRQGLTFKLRGLLGNMLGYPTKSTKVLLASSKLANFLKAGKEHNRTSHKNMSVRGPKFEVLEGSDAANRKAQNAFVERLILDENSLHVEGHDQAPPKSSLGASAEGQIPKMKLPLTSGSSSWSLTSNGAGNSCGSDTSTSCQYQGSEEVALKMGFSEIPPNDTSLPHHVDNSELRNVLLTKEASNTCAEISQEHPNLPNRVRPENVEGNAPKVPQTYSSHSHSQFEQTLPNCNFSTWSGQESNVYLSRHNLNMCKEWRHQFAKHQQEHRWPNHECMDRSVKAGFSKTYFPQSSQCFCSPFPASGYQCASDKGLNTHPQYAPCRFNPLAQSCPTSVHPLSHSQCQHNSNRQCLINKCLMLFPEQGKPASVTSCPTCHYCTERFSRSTRACQAQSELPSYQSSPSIFNNDCFWHPSEYFEEPASSEHLHAMKCGGTPSRLKPKKLLWLSEEEAEIIRLIRLSQVKDLSRCSSSYHASERTSPVLSARMGPEVQEEVNLNEARNPTVFSSRVSSSSLEDFASRAPESIISNLGIGELKCLLSEEEGLPIYDDAEALVVDDMETTNQVKPMVSSRLEPELKTRLLKAKFRGTALFRKRNFTQIKSRLFSYENSGLEGNDDTSSALFRDNVTECTINNRRKQPSLQVHSEVQPGHMNASPCNSKLHSSKQPSLRYSRKEDKKSVSREAADADFHTNLVSLPSQKVNGDKSSDVSAFEPLCKENKFLAAENQTKIQNHSKRYDSSKSSPDVWVSGASPDSSANCEKTQQMTKGDLCFSTNVEQPLSELELMFDHVINKQGEVTLTAYFGVNQKDSIVPRLYPNSSVFQCSRHKMTQIHQLLSKEGRAGRLQHNCLSFVSIRD